MRSLELFLDDVLVSKSLIFPFDILLFCLALQGRKMLNWVIKPTNLNWLFVLFFSLCVSILCLKFRSSSQRAKGTFKINLKEFLRKLTGPKRNRFFSEKSLMIHAGKFVIYHENWAFIVPWLHVHWILRRKTGKIKQQKQNKTVNCLGILATYWQTYSYLQVSMTA